MKVSPARTRVAALILVWLAAMPNATAQATDPPLEGKWEGEWNPQTRPYFVQVDLDARRVWIDAFGVKPITPKGWTSEAGTIRFYFDVGRRVDVTLHVEGDDLKGTISSKDRSAPITMKRLPVLPKPRDRIEAWQQDLDVLLNRFLPRDRSFSPQARAEFQADIANLREQIANLPDDVIAVDIAKAVALSNNAHTRLSLGRPRVRIRPARFSDGVFIVKADAKNTDLLGCRLETVAGRDVDEAGTAIGTTISGPGRWKRYGATYGLAQPALLATLGIGKDATSAEYGFQCGKRRVVRHLTASASSKPSDSWWDLMPTWPDVDGADRSVLPADDARLPDYLRRPRKAYASKYFSGKRALYFRYNRSGEDEGHPFADFAARLLAELDARHPAAVIVDLRFNSGGNFFVAYDLMEKLRTCSQLFVITSVVTYSAGITHAAQLRENRDAVFAGAEPGDDLIFWAEGGDLELPNSHLSAHYSNGVHCYTKASCPDANPFKALDSGSLAPQIALEPSFADYASGRDTALTAVFAALSAGAQR